MRPPSVLQPLTEDTPSFIIDANNKSYRHQYANIYFLRLRLLRKLVEKEAVRRWQGLAGSPVLVPRVLEVIKGRVCYMIGTVYMDMPLKPNVLEDLGRDRYLPAPTFRPKIYSSEDTISLEDESGRIKLVGERIKDVTLVTGVIAGVLGIETAGGDFEVLDVCFAGSASPEDHDKNNDEGSMQIDESSGDPSEEYLAIVSGLDLGSSNSSELHLQMLAEFLSGEDTEHSEGAFASRITRLVIAGNSLAPLDLTEDDTKERKKRHSTGVAKPHPIHDLSNLLADIARSMPIHLLAGSTDPSGIILPQQPLPRAMFGDASAYASFSCETNPTYLRIGIGADDELNSNGSSSSHAEEQTRTILISSGQPLNDLSTYVPESTTRLDLARSILQWRHVAPTAPDTLWCHPFFTTDPFAIRHAPDIYLHGCQPHFATRLVRTDGSRCRIVLVPSFAESGTLVLVGLKSLSVRTVNFAVQGITDVDI